MLISSKGKKGLNFTLYIQPTLNFQLISIAICQEIELISIISIFMINIYIFIRSTFTAWNKLQRYFPFIKNRGSGVGLPMVTNEIHSVW